MTPADIRARIHHAIIPALDRADRIIAECQKGPGKHHADRHKETK